MQNCPNCGYDIKNKDYKFCPSCGADLNKFKEETAEAKEIATEEIICDICGAVNIGGEFCSECGAKFTGNEKKTGKTVLKPVSGKGDVKSASVKSENKKTAPVNSGKPKKNIQKQEPVKSKFNAVQIATLIAVLIGTGILILLAAGVFDSPQPKQAEQHQHADTDPHNGVDMSSLQRINQLEDAVNANPNDTKTLLELAHLLNDSGFYNRAIERYNQYIKVAPNVPDVLIDLGVCYYNLGRYAEAKTEMLKAVKIDPKHQIGQFNLGIVALAAGNSQEAFEQFNKAIKINPNSDIAKRAQEQIDKNKLGGL